MKKTKILLFVNLIFSTCLQAEMPFFYEGTKPMGMGGAYTAVSNDDNAIYYNPAGLTQIEQKNVSISGLIQYYSWEVYLGNNFGWDLNYSDIQGVVSYSQKNIGISVCYKRKCDDLIEIPVLRTMPTSLDAIENHIIKPIDYETIIICSYSKELFTGLSIGISGKYVTFSNELWLPELESKTDLDIGMLYALNKNIQLGISCQNILRKEINYLIHPSDYLESSRLAFESPRSLNMGVSIRPFKSFLFAFDIHNINEDKILTADSSTKYEFKKSYHFGVEWLISNKSTIRLGYFIDNQPREFHYLANAPFVNKERSSLTLGFGYKLSKSQIDIAFIDDFRDKNPITGSVIRFLIVSTFYF
jgi:hypothetical protein